MKTTAHEQNRRSKWSAQPFVSGCHQRVNLFRSYVDRQRPCRLGGINYQDGAMIVGRSGHGGQIQPLTGGVLHMANANRGRAIIDQVHEFAWIYDVIRIGGKAHLAAGGARNSQPGIDNAGELHSRADHVVFGSRAQCPGQRA